jgi:hypothetical protein
MAAAGGVRTGASANTIPTGPCDLAGTAGTPCVAAYSVTRRLLASYSGPLFQLLRDPYEDTLDVGSSASTGVVDTSGVVAFCRRAGTKQCCFRTFYDQTGNGNNLIGSSGGCFILIAYQTATISSQTLPIALKSPGGSQKYNLRTGTTGIPMGNSAVTVYYVRSSAAYGGCCGSFGVAENRCADDGAGTMFQLGFVSNGTPPQFKYIVDREDGGENLPASSLGPIPSFFTHLAKYNPTGAHETQKLQNATIGTFRTIFDGVPGWTANFQGGIAFANGGDCTDSDAAFFEGAIIANVTSDNLDNAIQSNVVRFYGSTGVVGGAI